LIYAGCDGLLNSDDDDVIKITTANGGVVDGATRGLSGGRDDTSPPRPCTDRLQLSEWPDRPLASAPPLPSDVLVCLGTCRNGGYQTTTTTTSNTATVVPPPSYDESVCRCVQPGPRCHSHRQYHDYRGNTDLLTAHAAAQLNYYTNRT